MNGGFLLLILASVLLKIILIPCYFSTDFEVHRNWLAITHSLSISDWYYENTSEWTLDYPPFFGWFEYGWSQVAAYVDPNMLKINNTGYASTTAIYFHRSTVIVSDIVYFYSVHQICTLKSFMGLSKSSTEDYLLVIFLYIFNVGLIFVDHIHFQYNGFLTGILLLSIVRLVQRRHLESAILFAVLLNLKHIYLYIAPAYFVYLLGHFCFELVCKENSAPSYNFRPLRFLSLGFVVILVFLFSFGPFIIMGQISQVLSRLFPFKRGLCHAYWAPNAWAIYNVMDKGLLNLATKLSLHSATNNTGSMTGGLVQEFEHAVLPSIQPLHTMVITVVAMVPCLLTLWRCHCQPERKFIEAVVLCALSSFMFGWHVHEKAILLAIIPLTLLIFISKSYASVFFLLSTVGHYSLFPLIFTPKEATFKLFYFIFYTVVTYGALHRRYTTRITEPTYYTGRHFVKPQSSSSAGLVNWIEAVYLTCLPGLYLYTTWFHGYLGLAERLPFFPLLLTSLYCSFGVIMAYIKLYTISYNGIHMERSKTHSN